MTLSIRTHVAVLELLAAEVPESELLNAFAALRAEATELEERAEIDRVAGLAVGLHRSRVEDRRRAIGLTALSETAADLSTHRDLDELLLAICRRARLLLGTDVAYVTLGDPELGDTYVRTTDGIVSRAFREMRLPVGTGIGGLVAETRQPEMTADYANDDRLAHVRDVDRRVQEEGLRAIVAVPLQRGADVLGVVLSASRTVRRFEPQEVALFASLAAHATVAIENARLLRDSRQALHDLAHAHDELQAHARRVERVAVVQERLAELALQGADVRELLDATAQLLSSELELRAPDGELLASAAAAATAADDGSWIATRILGGADHLGTLRLRRREREGIEHEVLERLAVLAAGILLQERAQTEAEHRRRGRLLEELLDGRRAEDDEVRRSLARAGIAADRDHVVLVIAPAPSAERWAWLTAARATGSEQGLVTSVAGRMVVVVPGDDGETAATQWSEIVRGRGGEPPTIGAAVNATGISGLRVAHREAAGALSLLLAMEHAGRTATVAQLGVFGRMLGEHARSDLVLFLDRTLGAIVANDAGGRAELLPVLTAFFEEAGHLANTARRLHIHVNTLYQRLERIDALLGSDWREPDRRLELHLALRLRALDQKLREPAAAQPPTER